jgi:hypothetical protein
MDVLFTFEAGTGLNKMSKLLQLPREIRDEILSVLLHDALDQAAPTPSRVQKWNRKRDPNDVSAKKIRFPSLQPPSPALSALLFANRQMYDECREAVAHFENCGNPSLTFDLLIEDHGWLFPTVLQAPSYSLVLKMVRVQIRPYLSAGSTASGSFAATWRFGSLINTLLQHGPALNFSKKSKTFIIEELVVDIVTDASLKIPGASLEELVTHVQRLRDFMDKQMDGFMYVKDKRYFIPWGPFLLSRVRRLRIMDGGEMVLNIDMAERAHECGVALVSPPNTASSQR